MNEAADTRIFFLLPKAEQNIPVRSDLRVSQFRISQYQHAHLPYLY
jgi:hypothetical protein